VSPARNLVRLVFVNRYFFPDYSATSQILSDLAFALAERGEEIHVVTSRLSYDDPLALFPAREHLRGVTVHRVWTSRFGRKSLTGRLVDYFTFYPWAFFVLFRILRNGDVVVAKTDPPLISIPVWIAVWLRGAVLVNWLQDLFPEVAAALGVRAARGIPGLLLAWMRDQTLKAATVNVVLGSRMAAAIRRRGISDEQVVVVPNWADGELIRPLLTEPNPLRLEWHLTGKFVVGYSGNLGRAHEFGTILRAAELLRNDHDIVFLFIGQGHQHAWLQAEVARRRLNNVVFKPYQPRERLRISLTLPDVHLISLLPEMEGYVVPSKFYGIAAAGCPVAFIGASDGELAEVIQRFQCGVVIKPCHSEELVSFLRELRDAPVLRADFGRRIRIAFEENYDRKHAILTWQMLIGRFKTKT